VSRIEAIDPDADLDRFSLPRIAASSIAVDFHHLNAEHLPFAGNSFDTVVCTLTLCSIPDVVHALGEIHRVLKPGGQFLFLEHGLSPDARVARWQHRLNPIQNRIGGGCHLIRETVPLVAGSGLHLRDVEHYYLRRVPRFAGYMTEGSALKS
jgi:ubiquinone/menaquinone biosynthesis C-methylase UbiE